MYHPRTTHWTVVKRILPYLKHTSSLMAYSNADYAGDPDYRYSTSVYYIYIGKNLISWS